jgi:hypothetical protein
MSQTVIDLKALGKTALQIKQEGYVLSQINNIDVLFYFRDMYDSIFSLMEKYVDLNG